MLRLYLLWTVYYFLCKKENDFICFSPTNIHCLSNGSCLGRIRISKIREFGEKEDTFGGSSLNWFFRNTWSSVWQWINTYAKRIIQLQYWRKGLLCVVLLQVDPTSSVALWRRILDFLPFSFLPFVHPYKMIITDISQVRTYILDFKFWGSCFEPANSLVPTLGG